MQLFLNKSFSGLASFENKGLTGSFKFGRNLDVRKELDSLSCGQALVDDLAVGTLTDLVLFIVNCSDGNSYHFRRDGKIFKRDTNGSYTQVYDDSEAITGACEWVNNAGNEFLYWATPTKLHRKEIPGTSNWSDVDATVNGQTYPKSNLTSATWHTMLEMGGDLYICNSNKLAFVGYDDSYTTEALQLIPGNVSKCLMEYNNYAYIGCGRSDNSQRGYLFIWDMAQSLNWNGKRKYGASPINAMIDAEFPLVQVGSEGNLRLADISQYTLPIRAFPGGGEVNPDGVDADDLAYFGSFSNSADTDGTKRTGVYTFGRKRQEANPVLNLEYYLDCDEIGSVKKVGSDLLISYKSGSNYGIKKVSSTTKATGLYRSLDFRSPTSVKEPVWSKVRVVTKPLPTGCSLSVARRINKTDSFVTCNLQGGGTSFSTVGGTEAEFFIGEKGKICEIEITLTPSGNTTPEVLFYEVYFQ